MIKYVNWVKYTTLCKLYNKQLSFLTFFLDKNKEGGLMAYIFKIKFCCKSFFIKI